MFVVVGGDDCDGDDCDGGDVGGGIIEGEGWDVAYLQAH